MQSYRHCLTSLSSIACLLAYPTRGPLPPLVTHTTVEYTAVAFTTMCIRIAYCSASSNIFQWLRLFDCFEVIVMSFNISPSRIVGGIASNSMLSVCLILIDTHVINHILSWKELAEASIKPTSTIWILTVVGSAPRGQGGESPRGGDGGVEDDVGRLIRNGGIHHIQTTLLNAKFEFSIDVPS